MSILGISANNIDNVNNPNNKVSRKKRKNIGGTIVANMAGGLVFQVVFNSTCPKLAQVMSKQNTGTTQDEVKIVNKALDKVLNETELSKKGVKILNMINQQEQEINFLGKSHGSFVKDFFESLISGQAGSIRDGENAAYVHLMPKFPKKIANIYLDAGFEEKTVHINRNLFALSGFHELGHAFNANCTKFWKGMQKMRIPFMMLSGVAMLFPLLTKKEVPEDGQELTKKQKNKNNIRNLMPAVAFLTQMGVVAEEAMASARANKWTSQLLEAPLAKRIAKVNKFGLATYVVFAAAIGLAAFTTMKVKDFFAKKQQIKASNKLND